MTLPVLPRVESHYVRETELALPDLGDSTRPLVARPESTYTDFCGLPRTAASPPGATRAARCKAP